MQKKTILFTIVGLLLSTLVHAEDAKKEESKKEEPKKEEVKKEEPKKEEVKKEEPKKEEAKKEEAKPEEAKKEEPKKEEHKKVVKVKVPKKPRECTYQTNSLAVVDHERFDDEVKKIESNFEKCQSESLKEKEKEMKAKECGKLKDEAKEKRLAILKLVSTSKIATKEEFDKVLPEVKTLREELAKAELHLKEICQVTKSERKKEEPKKEEAKKEETKKEEPKKEEAKAEEVKKEEPKKEEAKKEEHK